MHSSVDTASVGGVNFEIFQIQFIIMESDTPHSVTIADVDHRQVDNTIAMNTVRLTINLLTNMFMFITVFTCLVFACRSKVGIFELHVILCVLGYQFFICQGILVLSRYNGWSIYLTKLHRKYIHLCFQLIGIAMVITGSVLIMKEKYSNFQTAHGVLGLLALLLSLISPINGIILHFGFKLTNHINVYWIRLSHIITAVSTLFFSAACLCFGFDSFVFRIWIRTEDYLITVLMIFTWIFTILVALDFWILSSKKIYNHCRK